VFIGRSKAKLVDAVADEYGLIANIVHVVRIKLASVGSSDGLMVGALVGSSVGRFVGLVEGSSVGRPVGPVEEFSVGSLVGRSNGLVVGIFVVGDPVGADVGLAGPGVLAVKSTVFGENVGVFVGGTDTGALLGLPEGRDVGDRLGGSAVGPIDGPRVGDDMGASVGASVPSHEPATRQLSSHETSAISLSFVEPPPPGASSHPPQEWLMHSYTTPCNDTRVPMK